MKAHLFFLNLLAAIWLVLFSPIAVKFNAQHTIDNIEELKESGVIDQKKLQAFSQTINQPTIAFDNQHFENWLNDSSNTNYWLIFPAFMVFLMNAFLMLRIVLSQQQT